MVFMKSNIITDIMVKDHAKILKLLNDVKKNIKSDRLTLMKSYDCFKWNLEKHFFTEEKAVFTGYEPEDVSSGYSMLPELIKEHNALLNRLDLMRRDLLRERSIDFDGFAADLIRHKSFEEEHLYPRLDKELSDEQKKLIVSRVNEII